jgi:hypothetical protein
VLLEDAQVSGVRCRRLPCFLSRQDEVSFEGAEVPTAPDDGRGALEVRQRTPGRAAAVHMVRAISSEVSLEAFNSAHEVHAGERGLIEYAAHTQMSDTLVVYLGDQRWPKHPIAEALE